MPSFQPCFNHNTVQKYPDLLDECSHTTGRIRELCDIFSSQGGFLVVLPGMC